MQQMGFVKSDVDPNVYYLMVEDEPLILVLYVDDLFLTKVIRAHRRLQEEPGSRV